MVGYEEKELVAGLLANAADQLGRVVKYVDTMERRDMETVRAELDAADAICMDGPKLIKALRQIERRYVR